MALPNTHPFVCLHDKLRAGFARLFADLVRYDAQRRDLFVRGPTLPPQDRARELDDLKHARMHLDAFWADLSTMQHSFIFLLEQSWEARLHEKDDEVMAGVLEGDIGNVEVMDEALEGDIKQLGAQLQQLWDLYRLSSR